MNSESPFTYEDTTMKKIIAACSLILASGGVFAGSGPFGNPDLGNRNSCGVRGFGMGGFMVL